MDSYKIPQQIKYKDEVIAGLTVRQALLIGVFAIPAYVLFRLPLPVYLRLFLALPVFSGGLVFAFYKHRGRYLEVWLFNWISYSMSSKYYKQADKEPPASGASLLSVAKSSILRGGGEAHVSSQVPIEGIERGLINIPTGYVMVLQVGSVNVRLKNEDARKKFWSSYRSFLNVLSMGFPIQFYITVRKQTVDEIEDHFSRVIESQKSAELLELARDEKAFILETLKTTSVVSRSFYVVIPYNPSFSTSQDGISLFKQALSRRKSVKSDIDIAHKHLAARRDNVMSHLKKLGVEARQLTDEELFELLYDGFNPSVAKGGYVKHDLKSIYAHVKRNKLVRFISPSYLEIGPDYADMAGVYMRTVFPLDYPGTVFDGWLQPLIEHDQDCDISMHISPMDSTATMNTLNRNLSKMISTKRYRAHRGKIEDVHVEAKAEDSVYLLNKLVRSETKLFNVGLYVTVRSHTLDELDERTDSVVAIMESMQMTPGVAKYQMAAAVATNLPLAQDRLCYMRNMDSDSLATAMPLSSADLSGQGGVLYGMNTDNSSLVMFDRFNQRNANSVVLGSSGAGKSYFTKIESLRYLLEGVSIVIIDPEREYESICSRVDGQYINISRNPSQHLNPFDPYIDVEGIRGIDRQVGDATALIKLMAPEVSIPRSRLEELLYATFKEQEAPLLADLYRLSKDRGLEELADAIYPWHAGSLRNIFSRPTDVNLTSDYVVFDVSEMDEDLRPVAMQVILSWIWRNILSNPKPRLIYCDEAWSLLESAGDWFSAAYRRARKHWAGFTITEHQVETLLNSDVMKAILVNSATKVLFAQEPSALPALTSAFDLTEGEQMSILATQPGEGLLYAANSHVSLKVIASEGYVPFLSTSPELLYAKEVAGG